MGEKKYSILYLDDEESNLRIFRAAFKQYYKIFTANSGPEGVQILRENSIQLIITDQRMPRMTGVEFLENIIPEFPDPIRIILTGFSDIEDIIRALNKCGIYRYIVKPWNREEMKLTIDKALETWQLRQDNLNLIDELKTINNSLEEKIQERTVELTRTNELLTVAKEKAEDASRAKERFLSTMSHEIRTPLNAIIGVANLLKQSPLDQEQADNVKILEFSAKNLLALINDILDISKIEAGKIELEQVPFQLKSLLNSTVKSMESKAKEKALALGVQLDEQLPEYVVGDQYRLGQILLNLVGNAIKFTEEGSVNLEVTVLERMGDKAVVKFAVHDTGIGIEANMIEKIFEDFSQASSDTTRKFGGTGLGLAIAKKLVELHKGRIAVESQPNVGSTFHFTVEYAVAEPKPSADTKEGAQLPYKDLTGVHVLVVEDNHFNQAIARKFLTGWGAEVTIANNGKVALEVLRNDRSFKVILMDIQMPEMDGYETTRHIRNMPQPYYKEIPIIALSASTLSGEHDRAVSIGMNDYMVKPFDPNTLYERIVRQLSGHVEQVMEKVKTAKERATGEVNFDRLKRMAEYDDNFYLELLEIALEEYQLFAQEFLDACTRSDEDMISEVCHKIRPSLIVLGLEWLDKDVLNLREHTAEHGLDAAYQTSMDHIQHHLSLLQQTIAREIEQVKAQLE